ncbi:PQQ-dependent catabolism-associated CXXCW motif protein [Xanthobacter versatilis]|uniref:PQQ-dependent catabolism-associated CXXCW motif protein n=1 Tax=Xanthobacter autotrophicus (strain ATCC BAA-1158 / Py2) TaxID=78245 RepID=UPI0037295897
MTPGGAATAAVGGIARAALAAFCVVVCLSISIAAAEEAPPEPADYRLEAYRAPTPATLAGAKVLDTDAAAELWRAGTAAFIDVLPRPPRPAGLPAGTVWRDPPHDSIPGAMWLPNVGFGALNADTEAYFRAGLDAASRGDVNAPLVIFCQRQCWMSWNAAKRALEDGYRNVAWFPEGTDGWSQAGLPLVPATPRP